MQLSDWDQRWTEGRIDFHQQDVSDFLTKYADRVWGESDLSRVLVPLCGKSLDMVFLAERSRAVVGVEFVTQAVVEFFAEQGLTPAVDTEDRRKYVADRYALFAADFFDVSAQDVGPVDAVFDRASLVALNTETRV
ncbi:MAG: thiopurine S-methyltransferase, partial [Actinobacteria bacterium]|nr:thiopurine S-methyltransferase [Actinomycetota bacterium]